MKQNKLIKAITVISDNVEKNKPAVLLGCTIVGVILTATSAYKFGQKMTKIKKTYNEDMNKVDPADTKAKVSVVKEVAKEVIPAAIPTAIIGGATIACAVGSHSESMKRIALLTAAYNLSETTVKDLNNKMQDMLGDKKTKSIKDAIAKDKLNADKSPIINENIIITGNGDVLCKDLHSGRYFYSNSEKIGQVINKMSSDIQTEMYISLNDFYSELGIPRIPLGDDLGWNIDDCQRGMLPITKSPLLTEDGRPCICIDYDVSPRFDYRRLH